MKPILLTLVLLTLSLGLTLLLRPDLSLGTRGRVLSFLSLFLLPVLVLALGSSYHLENSKTTEFCLSCHVMEPYGESLAIDDSEYLPANHFQNGLIPRDQACYACHTQYTMYGDLQAKLAGFQHLWVNYLGTPPETLALYQPYKNRECLHCHGGARSYEESDLHADIREELASDETSCLECHEFVHAVDELESLDKWTPEAPS